jgi:hypothetical protein
LISTYISKLTSEQEAFLAQHRTQAMSEFESAANDLGSNAKKSILSSAATENKRAQN